METTERQKVRLVVGWRHRETATRDMKTRIRTAQNTFKMVTLAQKKKA